MLAHSVEKRFIAIILLALLALVAPLFVLFFLLSADRYHRDLMERGEIMLQANAKALGKPLWDLDTESVREMARAIATGRNVTAVHVRDTSGVVNVIVAPGEMGKPRAGETGTLLTADIDHQTAEGVRRVGTLEIRLASPSILTGDYGRDLAFFTIFAIAIAAVVLAAVVGNRLLVIKPLLRLLGAIEDTRRLGSRHQVDWVSDDEIGMLAASFNQMQEQLAREEKGFKLAHARINQIYNKTPAMLYSVDSRDKVIAVSDYWLLATGYGRDQVLGRIFSDFLEPESRPLFSTRTEEPGTRENGVTVKFRCADDRVIDVLIREAVMEPMMSQPASALSVMTDVSELKAAERQNHVQAITDHLTGLLNRQGFEIAIGERIGIADAEKSELACLFIDLDRFKWINDNLGHAAGDELLREVVRLIKAELGTEDVIARLGGDEFAVLISAERAGPAAIAVADRISHAVERQVEISGSLVNVSASIGVALYPEHAPTAAELLQKSDLAMYARKKAGKNGTRLFDPDLAAAARHRAGTEKNIEAGLREDWFEAYLQPIFDLKSGRIAGFEALMRLVHPVEGILPPQGIIQIAEETGSISRIGERIFDKAISRLAEFSGYPNFADAYIAVNVSPLQFEASLPEHMLATLMKHGVLPSRVVIEITEAVLMHHNPAIQQVLKTLSGAGFRIALDDFGTGYSSLSYLHRFAVDIVKIDQSFVNAITSEDDEARRKSIMLVEGIKTISHQMNCSVVAEGVETEAQRKALTAMGVDAGQGYLFSRPLPAAEIIARFADASGKTSGRAKVA